jgi:hypothetical protein
MATNPQRLLIGAGSVLTQAGCNAASITHSTPYYEDLGGYRDSLTVRFSEERFNLEVADHLMYVKSARTRMDAFVNTSLVQATFDSLSAAFGGISGYETGNRAAPVQTSVELFADDPGAAAMKFVGGTAGAAATFQLASYIFSQTVPMTDSELSYAKDGETLIPASYMVLGTVSGAAGAGTYQVGFGWVDRNVNI